MRFFPIDGIELDLSTSLFKRLPDGIFPCFPKVRVFGPGLPHGPPWAQPTMPLLPCNREMPEMRWRCHEAKQYDVFITVFRHFDVDGNGHLEAPWSCGGRILWGIPQTTGFNETQSRFELDDLDI